MRIILPTSSPQWLPNAAGLLLLLGAAFLAGCATGSESPTTALVRGELSADEYLEAIKDANEEERANAQFQFNKEPTRAYNTNTGRFEYVPEGTTQSWNEETQRWEFTPVE